MKSLAGPVLCGVSLLLAAPVFADATQNCHVGSYRLRDGATVDIAPSDGNTLRWRKFSGDTGQLRPQKDGTWASSHGWTTRSDGMTVSFSDCTRGEIRF